MSHADVKLGQGDVVEPALDTKLPSGFFNINIYRSRPIIIIDEGHSYHISTGHQSPRQIVADAGLVLYSEDQVNIGVVTDFVGDDAVGTRLVITRATPATIKVDGKLLAVRTQAKTVNQLLSERGISLGVADTVAPSVDHGIVPGISITIARVTEATVTAHVVLPRPTQTVLDPTMSRDNSQVSQAGSDGQESITYHIHYRDGVEVARETIKIADKVEPTAKIIIQGTKVFFAGNIEYWRPYVTEAASAQGVNPDLMLGIMRCESNGNANASNGTHFGLYQYDSTTWMGVGGTHDNIYDGPSQITATAWKISHYGLSAWASSKFCWNKYQ